MIFFIAYSAVITASVAFALQSNEERCGKKQISMPVISFLLLPSVS
jgi:hypothetical protein